MAQGKQTVPVLSSVIKGFLGWQTVLLVGVGLVSRYGAELIDWATGADKAKAKAEALKKQQEELNQIDEQATKNAGDQIGKLTALNAVITDSNLPMSKRKAAYEELQKLYPSYLNNLSLDKASNGALADIINIKLIPAIIAASKARAFQEKINKLTSENIDLEEKRVKALDKTTRGYFNLNEARSRANEYGGSTFTAPGSGGVDLYTSSANSAKNKFNEAQDSVDSLTKQIDDNKASINDFISGLQTAVSETGNLGTDGIDPLTHKTKQSKEKIDALTKSSEKLSDKFTEIQGLLQNGLISSLDATQQKFDAVRAHIVDLIKNGDKTHLQEYIDLLQRLNYQISQMKPIDLEAAKGLKGISASDSFSKDFHEVTKGNEDRAASFGNDAFKQVGDPEKAIKRREEGVKELNRQYNHTYALINKIVGGPLDSFTNAIFDGENAMDALGNSIKDLVKNLAAAVIKAGVFSAIMSAINPLGFASGGGFGGILGKLLPFATGGIVTGPTPALVGEAGPEAIIPLNKLGSIMGNREMNVNVRGDIRGRNIKLANDRETAFKTR